MTTTRKDWFERHFERLRTQPRPSTHLRAWLWLVKEVPIYLFELLYLRLLFLRQGVALIKLSLQLRTPGIRKFQMVAQDGCRAVLVDQPLEPTKKFPTHIAGIFEDKIATQPSETTPKD